MAVAPRRSASAIEDQRAVLRNVVRGATERPGELGHDLAFLVIANRAGARRARVAARGAVRVEHEPHAPKICASRERSTFPPDTIDTTISPGRTAIFPASNAPVAAAPPGSATSFARDARKRIPSAITSSSITTTSATRRRTISNGMVPRLGRQDRRRSFRCARGERVRPHRELASLRRRRLARRRRSARPVSWPPRRSRRRR